MAFHGGLKSFERKQISFSPFVHSGDILYPRKLANDSSYHLEFLAWLKRMALDPKNLAICRDSNDKLFHRILKIRRYLFNRNDESTQRKRKLEQYVRGDNLTACGMELKKYDSPNVKKLVMQQFDATSCITNLNYTTKCFNMQHTYNSINRRNSSIGLNSSEEKNEFSNLIKGNKNESPSLSSDDVGPAISTHGKVHVSNQDGLEALDVENMSSLNITDLVYYELLSSEESKGTRQLAFSLLMFKGEYLPRPEVPVSSKFQAEIPDLMDAHSYNKNAFENIRWLGSQVWPIEGGCVEKYPEVIGKGRLNCCSCELLGSPECIIRHIAEAREILASDLGPAFLMWKFNEIGQQVSSTWTLEEEDCFVELINRYPLTSEANFWDRAINHLPKKCRESILSYYYNVFIPRHMSNQFQSSLDHIISDDDEPEDDE